LFIHAAPKRVTELQYAHGCFLFRLPNDSARAAA